MIPRQVAKDYIDDLRRVLGELSLTALAQFLELLKEAHQQDKQVFLIGNGGSAATASHMANDMVKGVAVYGGHGFRAHSLTDNVALFTAIANDHGYNQVFADQLTTLAKPRDLLIVISGSGNSPNILRALERASEMGLATVGLLGKGGGKAAGLVDLAIIVPSDDYGPIEDAHMMIDHLVMTYFQHLQRPQG